VSISSDPYLIAKRQGAPDCSDNSIDLLHAQRQMGKCQLLSGDDCIILQHNQSATTSTLVNAGRLW